MDGVGPSAWTDETGVEKPNFGGRFKNHPTTSYVWCNYIRGLLVLIS